MPWENAYRSTQLLGGDKRFVLSTSGHIQALVNPPAPDSRSSYRVADEHPADPQAFLDQAAKLPGSWWPDYVRVARRALRRPAAGAQAARRPRPPRARQGSRHLRLRELIGDDAMPMPYQHLGEALATDYFFVREQFTDEQWEHFLRTRRFVDEEVLPAINDYWERAELAWPLFRRLGELGLVGDDIEGYGCPGMSSLAWGLVHMEVNRGDGSLGTFLGVQSGLAMRSDQPARLRRAARALAARAWPASSRPARSR